MNEDEDYFLDDEEDSSDMYVNTTEDDADIEQAERDDLEQSSSKKSKAAVTADYKSSTLSDFEINLIQRYDNITAIAKDPKIKSDDVLMMNMARELLYGNPVNTSQGQVENYVRDLSNKQGRARASFNTKLSENNVFEVDGEDDDDDQINRDLVEENTLLISRFVEYLANRDLSKDSKVSINHKQRHIPALIIFLFYTGNDKLVTNCDTLPPVYKRQVENANKTLVKKRFELVEELAKRYEEIGHKEMAKLVRKKQLSFFDREPATLKTIVEFKGIITDEDIEIYKKEIRPKYMNISKAITQEIASDLIQVCVDEKRLIFQPMKDKTRFEAIQEMKDIFANWVKENYQDSDIANRILWQN